jgi:hypothetical protein
VRLKSSLDPAPIAKIFSKFILPDTWLFLLRPGRPSGGAQVLRHAPE